MANTSSNTPLVACPAPSGKLAVVRSEAHQANGVRVCQSGREGGLGERRSQVPFPQRPRPPGTASGTKPTAPPGKMRPNPPAWGRGRGSFRPSGTSSIQETDENRPVSEDTNEYEEAKGGDVPLDPLIIRFRLVWGFEDTGVVVTGCVTSRCSCPWASSRPLSVRFDCGCGRLRLILPLRVLLAGGGSPSDGRTTRARRRVSLFVGSGRVGCYSSIIRGDGCNVL